MKKKKNHLFEKIIKNICDRHYGNTAKALRKPALPLSELIREEMGPLIKITSNKR